MERVDKPQIAGGVLWCIVLLGGVLRLLRHFFEPLPSRDAVLYMEQAMMWERGGWQMLSESISSWIPPLLPWLTCCLMRCGLSVYDAGIYLNLLAGTLLIAALYFLTVEFMNSRFWGLIGALFAAFLPAFIKYSTMIQRESLYLLLLSLALWSIVAALNKRGEYWFILSGAFFTGAVLARYEALELSVMFFIFILLRIVAVSGERWRTARMFLWFVCGATVSALLFGALLGLPFSYYVNSLWPRVAEMSGLK